MARKEKWAQGALLRVLAAIANGARPLPIRWRHGPTLTFAGAAPTAPASSSSSSSSTTAPAAAAPQSSAGTGAPGATVAEGTGGLVASVRLSALPIPTQARLRSMAEAGLLGWSPGFSVTTSTSGGPGARPTYRRGQYRSQLQQPRQTAGDQWEVVQDADLIELSLTPRPVYRGTTVRVRNGWLTGLAVPYERWMTLPDGVADRG